MDARKTLFLKETLFREAERGLGQPITRATGLVAFRNPAAGKGFVEDLSELFDLGRAAGDMLSETIVTMLDGSPASYGKAAIVGTAGQVEHGAACIHPKLGKPMRESMGGGKALIPSNCKIGGVGAAIDVPLGDKDDIWSFPSFDTMTVFLPDGPLPEEIVVVVAMADGGRVWPRVGSAPITD